MSLSVTLSAVLQTQAHVLEEPVPLTDEESAEAQAIHEGRAYCSWPHEA